MLHYLDNGGIGKRLMRNKAELAIVVCLEIVVMVKGRNDAADCNHLGDDDGGENAEKRLFSLK